GRPEDALVVRPDELGRAHVDAAVAVDVAARVDGAVRVAVDAVHLAVRVLRDRALAAERAVADVGVEILVDGAPRRAVPAGAAAHVPRGRAGGRHRADARVARDLVAGARIELADGSLFAVRDPDGEGRRHRAPERERALVDDHAFGVVLGRHPPAGSRDRLRRAPGPAI